MLSTSDTRHHILVEIRIYMNIHFILEIKAAGSSETLVST